MKGLLVALALLSAPQAAMAYLPPAFFLYSKIAEQKPKTPVTSLSVTVARPQAGNTEEILGTLQLTDWRLTKKGSWPTLNILFPEDQESLVRAVTAFGLVVTPETDLLRVDRSRLANLKEPPRPFYKMDKTMQLKRTRQTYAWVHMNADEDLSIWVEKDSLLPLKIAAPCPAAAAQLSWAKAGENKCELEFRNLLALRRGNFQSTRLTLWKDGTPLLFFTFDRLGNARSKAPSAEGGLPAEVKSIAETILH